MPPCSLAALTPVSESVWLFSLGAPGESSAYRMDALIMRGESSSVASVFASYLFKFFFALIDTPLFYLGVYLLKDKVHEDPEEKKWDYKSFKEEAF